MTETRGINARASGGRAGLQRGNVATALARGVFHPDKSRPISRSSASTSGRKCARSRASIFGIERGEFLAAAETEFPYAGALEDVDRPVHRCRPSSRSALRAFFSELRTARRAVTVLTRSDAIARAAGRPPHPPNTFTNNGATLRP